MRLGDRRRATAGMGPLRVTAINLDGRAVLRMRDSYGCALGYYDSVEQIAAYGYDLADVTIEEE